MSYLGSTFILNSSMKIKQCFSCRNSSTWVSSPESMNLLVRTWCSISPVTAFKTSSCLLFSLFFLSLYFCFRLKNENAKLFTSIHIMYAFLYVCRTLSTSLFPHFLFASLHFIDNTLQRKATLIITVYVNYDVISASYSVYCYDTSQWWRAVTLILDIPRTEMFILMKGIYCVSECATGEFNSCSYNEYD